MLRRLSPTCAQVFIISAIDSDNSTCTTPDCLHGRHNLHIPGSGGVDSNLPRQCQAVTWPVLPYRLPWQPVSSPTGCYGNNEHYVLYLHKKESLTVGPSLIPRPSPFVLGTRLSRYWHAVVYIMHVAPLQNTHICTANSLDQRVHSGPMDGFSWVCSLPTSIVHANEDKP